MGVVNITPDSFSGDGRLNARAAVARAVELHAAGADVLDLGAESTRPGASVLDAQEEWRRLRPVLRAVRAALPDAVLSVDTYKPQVFARAHADGADWLNSVWAFENEALLALASRLNVPAVVMHNARQARYGDVVSEVLQYLTAQAARALDAGLRREAVIVDPGIGFGKTAEDNVALLAALDRLVAVGFPTMLGTSRKSTLGKLTGRPVGERTYATAATVALAARAGIDIVRVHDVAAMLDVIRTSDAIARGWRPTSWEGRTLGEAGSPTRVERRR